MNGKLYDKMQGTIAVDIATHNIKKMTNIVHFSLQMENLMGK
jgi:hypothetical protein